jgi:hypothetical protein
LAGQNRVGQGKIKPNMKKKYNIHSKNKNYKKNSTVNTTNNKKYGT